MTLDFKRLCGLAQLLFERITRPNRLRHRGVVFSLLFGQMCGSCRQLRRVSLLRLGACRAVRVLVVLPCFFKRAVPGGFLNEPLLERCVAFGRFLGGDG